MSGSLGKFRGSQIEQWKKGPWLRVSRGFDITQLYGDYPHWNQHRPWKSMVGRWSRSSFWDFVYFQRRTVSFREGISYSMKEGSLLIKQPGFHGNLRSHSHTPKIPWMFHQQFMKEFLSNCGGLGYLPRGPVGKIIEKYLVGIFFRGSAAGKGGFRCGKASSVDGGDGGA